MTDKQKQTISLINELRYDRKVITHEEYFLLLECVLGGEEPKIYSPTTPLKVPTLQCYEPNGVCTNPFHDCINCPKPYGSGATTITTTDDQIARPHKHFGFDIGDPKGDIGIKEEQQ